MITETDTRVQDAPFVCEADGCDQTFQTAGGRGSHMSRVHGVKGTSRAAMQSRVKNQTKAKAKKEAKLKASGPMTTSLMVTDGEFGIDGMLQAFFPAGIPSEKIPAVTRWIEVTKELMA